MKERQRLASPNNAIVHLLSKGRFLRRTMKIDRFLNSRNKGMEQFDSKNINADLTITLSLSFHLSQFHV
jgi:hypothetical protein